MVLGDKVIIRRLFLPEIFGGKIGVKNFKGVKVRGPGTSINL
jgi:hypothetical protein